ncbi:MAG TPA: UDP-N-acetylmuramoyl-tripeptide--D-alanyl-D-alanine ligase [Paludibacteraceae bacterium]|nr:UDP-N-acetylmuramoyl-tripeptide--D-alanyl-D-alanine ligase [Paludibacteraceae bacterium]HQF49309.1 UDP-N-acetylmuramoyl-tripeptide--D-alanyl-D-alanine ligase [Paludibacteraceae bacterium]HQJ89018.1 UDP-N-acetylmuramoyl-tripeptide--D-alanyl-D-alanine ligase [Paludibacteraceae bacterium]
MEIKEIYSLYKAHPSITTDSRNCSENSIFFAMKGVSFNGNEYAQKAIENGCSYAFVDEKQYANGTNILYVENCLSTLQQLAKFHRVTLGTKIIGITGTNGKTTTKELVSAVLQRKYSTLYTQGNFNNHLGVPLTLLRLTSEHEIAVVEMGANHPGEIRELVEIVRPNYGIITNVGKAHLEGFGSFEGVVKTKAALYEFLRETNGEIFINYDNEILQSISSGIKAFKFGKNSNYDVVADIYSSDPFLSVEWHDKIIQTHLIGAYNFENVMAAIAVGHKMGISDDEIVAAIEAYEPTNNRSQFKDSGRNQLIIDAYNANPTSMNASLHDFLQMNKPNKIVILGDMKELGADSMKEHVAIAELLKKSDLKDVFLIGPCFMESTDQFHRFETTDELIDWLRLNPINNSNLLIKGSNSMHLTKVVDLL